MHTVLVIVGTRPEAIKMVPVIRQLQNSKLLNVKLCVTGQHRELLDQVINLFGLIPDYDLNIMSKGQDLNNITSRILCEIKPVLESCRPDVVLVHGDTTTALASSLASFYNQIKIGHVEAGLRTNNKHSPWPEEMNRRLIGRLSDLHFAPTQAAYNILVNEGVCPDDVFITGNTVVDNFLEVVRLLKDDTKLSDSLQKKFSFLA